MDIDYSFIPTNNVRSLVSIADGQGVGQGSGRNLVLLQESPVYAFDLGAYVNDHSGVDSFHSEWGDDEFQLYVQGVLSLRGTMYGYGEFWC